MIGIGFQLPQHDNWAGALWGGTKAAANAAYHTAENVVAGGFEVPAQDGHGTKHVSIDRGFLLKSLPGQIANAYSAHTFSVREPEKFKKFQESVHQFQHGAAPTSKPNQQ